MGLLLSDAGLQPRAAGEAACAAAARACPMRSTCKLGNLVNADHGLPRVNSGQLCLAPHSRPIALQPLKQTSGPQLPFPSSNYQLPAPWQGA